MHGVSLLFFDWQNTSLIFSMIGAWIWKVWITLPGEGTACRNPQSKIENHNGGVLDSTLGWTVLLPFEDEGWPR
jgi:hypothetical protein